MDQSGKFVVISPTGDIVAGPMHQVTGLLLVDIDIRQVAAARRSLGIVGHDARPDIFTLQVKARAQRPVEFKE